MKKQMLAGIVLLLALPACNSGDDPTGPNCAPPSVVGSCALIGAETITSIQGFQIDRGGSGSCPVRSGDTAQLSITMTNPNSGWKWADFRLLNGQGVGPLFILTPTSGPASPEAIGIQVRFGSFDPGGTTSFQISVGLLNAVGTLVQQCDVRVTGETGG